MFKNAIDLFDIFGFKIRAEASRSGPIQAGC
jgi:hypothetical protein